MSFYNYPPVLEYKLNASGGVKYSIEDPQEEPDKVSFIRVEFQPGRANKFPAPGHISAIMLKVRTIPNNVNPFDKDYIIPVNNDTYINEALVVKTGTSVLNGSGEIFPEIKDHLNFGQHYKVQLALVDVTQGQNNSNDFDISPISNVGIMKFTTIPELSIKGDGITFSGYYSQKVSHTDSQDVTTEYAQDYSEKVEFYRFEVLGQVDGTFVLLDSTEWKVHDSSTNETDYSSYDVLDIYKLYFVPFKIRYYVRTTNNLISPDGSEYLSDSEVLSPLSPELPDPSYDIEGEFDFDNGYVSIYTPVPYLFKRILVRLNPLTKEDDIIYVFKGAGDNTFLDFTVEQGITYTYKVYLKTNNTWYMTELYQINVDFEDMFLTDGNGRQLKIRYNPSISAIHETILESKIETIGGKYPFFSRNQSVRYRDFQIGGLISLQMDEQQLFSAHYGLPDQPARERTYTAATQEDNQYLEDLIKYGYTSSLTDQTAPNFFRERKFREEVLDWLNNGQHKLFRSQSEGILIVRLMSVNMTPYNGTGRLVYSFSAQAYEATGHDIPDLVELGLLDYKDAESYIISGGNNS